MDIIIGSARIDENGKISGGKAGDNKQTPSTNDTTGEVSMQAMYTHSKGWYIIRPKDITIANNIANAMKIACNNKHIGYDQSNRLGVITYGVDSETDTECDCSSLVRACIKKATGKDVGNFTTGNEKTMLSKSGLFEKAIAYVNQSSTPVYNGDILVTKSKGHTVIVVSGNPRISASTQTNNYYPKYNGTTTSIVDALLSVGETDTSINHRKKIALSNGFTSYSGKANENIYMLSLLKQGILKKGVSVETNNYYPKYNGTTTSIVDALSSVGETDTSIHHRKKIALANGFTSYSGKADENIYMLSLLKQGILKKG